MSFTTLINTSNIYNITSDVARTIILIALPMILQSFSFYYSRIDLGEILAPKP
jgi:hypothetical protein